ncbi:hypothetical protein PPL_10240 [Heterostelium album PN500]|uniref:Uncharacterized protein n=1 Tax=Heterostelium pallidum (strain ATCC 26659 / Pp 5 / PN500) TaxID=670386 RepID=D3BQQ4_HETP5|nr:hypothetical protein PPL_10240 [Heterostelium album PN500]EFA76474.1 hypothetical protein PPL_10240 [Heterostelium album PN500]|eukprot:XP_020428606.1 hypothetical protein PPL_10240 [Heterostelium album PN500]
MSSSSTTSTAESPSTSSEILAKLPQNIALIFAKEDDEYTIVDYITLMEYIFVTSAKSDISYLYTCLTKLYFQLLKANSNYNHEDENEQSNGSGINEVHLNAFKQLLLVLPKNGIALIDSSLQLSFARCYYLVLLLSCQSSDAEVVVDNGDHGQLSKYNQLLNETIEAIDEHVKNNVKEYLYGAHFFYQMAKNAAYFKLKSSSTTSSSSSDESSSSPPLESWFHSAVKIHRISYKIEHEEELEAFCEYLAQLQDDGDVDQQSAITMMLCASVLEISERCILNITQQTQQMQDVMRQVLLQLSMGSLFYKSDFETIFPKIRKALIFVAVRNDDLSQKQQSFEQFTQGLNMYTNYIQIEADNAKEFLDAKREELAKLEIDYNKVKDIISTSTTSTSTEKDNNNDNNQLVDNVDIKHFIETYHSKDDEDEDEKEENKKQENDNLSIENRIKEIHSKSKSEILERINVYQWVSNVFTDTNAVRHRYEG